MKAYEYVRILSIDQNEDRQVIVMRESGVPASLIYIDKRSGRDFNRPQYRKLLRKTKKDNMLYIESIDHLGRNYEEIQQQ